MNWKYFASLLFALIVLAFAGVRYVLLPGIQSNRQDMDRAGQDIRHDVDEFQRAVGLWVQPDLRGNESDVFIFDRAHDKYLLSGGLAIDRWLKDEQKIHGKYPTELSQEIIAMTNETAIVFEGSEIDSIRFYQLDSPNEPFAYPGIGVYLCSQGEYYTIQVLDQDGEELFAREGEDLAAADTTKTQ